MDCRISYNLLIGDMTESMDMVELNREKEQVGDKGQTRGRGPDNVP